MVTSINHALDRLQEELHLQTLNSSECQNFLELEVMLLKEQVATKENATAILTETVIAELKEKNNEMQQQVTKASLEIEELSKKAKEQDEKLQKDIESSNSKNNDIIEQLRYEIESLRKDVRNKELMKNKESTKFRQASMNVKRLTLENERLLMKRQKNSHQ